MLYRRSRTIGRGVLDEWNSLQHAKIWLDLVSWSRLWIGMSLRTHCAKCNLDSQGNSSSLSTKGSGLTSSTPLPGRKSVKVCVVKVLISPL